MSRFYFHLRQRRSLLLRDPEGQALAADAVAEMALHQVRSLMADDILSTGRIDLRPRLDVEDGAGRLVHSLDFVDALSFEHPEPAADREGGTATLQRVDVAARWKARGPDRRHLGCGRGAVRERRHLQRRRFAGDRLHPADIPRRPR